MTGPKNILIFGASGATGRELLKQALEQGHIVTSFVRDPAKLSVAHERLKIIQGDVKDYSLIHDAIQEQHAVCSALGVSKPLNRDPVVVEGVKNIIKAMESNGVKRLIYLSFIGVEESRMDAGFMIRNVISRIVHNEIADHEEKERLIRLSHLDWTIVRPPKLTNGSRTGIYRSGEAITTSAFLPTMSRGDVADFMLRQLMNDSFIRKAPRILY